MSRGIYLISMAGSSGTISHDVSDYAASRYSLSLGGDMGGGDVAINAGYGSTFVPIMITGKASGLHVPLVASVDEGLYTFDAICDVLQFVLSGATDADLDFYLFPEMRY